MPKRTNYNQLFDADGNIIEETIVDVIEYPDAETSLVAATKLTLDGTVLETLPDEDVEELSGIFEDWRAWIPVVAGEIYRYDGTLVECLQSHTTQPDWTPDVVPALWRIFRTPDMVEWTANVLYNVGDEVTYLAVSYRCLQTHTSLPGWEPPNVPALWVAI